jgi:3-deoxy-7-phosphoheptulonate synthase
VVKSLVDIPIIVDPSHAAGNKDYVIALSKAAKAVGADGLLVEVHPNPEQALSDVKQQITIEMLEQLVNELGGIK